MKNLCFLLLLISGTANADYWSYPTKDKGEIILTLEQFSKDHIAKKCRGWYAAYVLDKFNRVIYGCWSLSNDKINVYYTDGDFRVYDKNGWIFHKDEKMKAPIRRLTVDNRFGGFSANGYVGCEHAIDDEWHCEQSNWHVRWCRDISSHDTKASTHRKL